MLFLNIRSLLEVPRFENWDNAIYIGTQERLLERTDIQNIDLFIIDEFYKLDLEREDQRSVALNAILARHSRRAKQIYLLGPSIDDVPNIKQFRNDVEFIRTKYSPVTADIIDRTKEGPDPEALIRDLRTVKGSSSLIYVQSPPSAARLTYKLLEADIFTETSFCADFGEWLKQYFHPQWVLAESVARGVGIHHGRIPRSIAYLMISLFNKGDLAAIVCTSSMIEGVNTAAENVFIFDRNISTTKLDRFTFDNIKGRAGRMFRHNIGKIYMYNPAPKESDFAVRIPLFGTDELMMPELLVQLEDDALTQVARRRKKAITNSSALPAKLLATWAEFGIDELNALAETLADEFSSPHTLLGWKGVPSFNQIEATFGLVWTGLRFPKHDIRTPKQLALFSDRLRRSGSMRGYLDGFVRDVGPAAQPQIDQCFNFLRGAEYTFAQVLRALNDIADVVLGEDVVNYRVYAAQLQNLFLPGELRALDEYGVPLPLVQRIAGRLDADDVDGARAALASPEAPSRLGLSGFEAELLKLGLRS